MRIILRFIVETGDIKSSGKTIVYNSAILIHTACHRTCRIKTVAYVLQHHKLAHAIWSPLTRNLIAHRPHHHGGIVAVMAQHVLHIFLSPFSENRAVAVLALRTESPVVKWLDHQHHAHLVAKLHKLRGWHVMRCADCIRSHLLQHLDLMCKGGSVYR